MEYIKLLVRSRWELLADEVNVLQKNYRWSKNSDLLKSRYLDHMFLEEKEAYNLWH